MTPQKERQRIRKTIRRSETGLQEEKTKKKNEKKDKKKKRTQSKTIAENQNEMGGKQKEGRQTEKRLNGFWKEFLHY